MGKLNFLCLKCQKSFDCNVGKIDFDNMVDNRPQFENDVCCPNCGVLSISRKEVELTELGQTQIGDLYFDGM